MSELTHAPFDTREQVVKHVEGATDFAGKIDGAGKKAATSDPNKVPLDLMPSAVLGMAMPMQLIDFNDLGYDPMLCLAAWLEGGDDALLHKALRSIAARGGWPMLLQGIGQVLGYGAKKYASHNWRKGIKFSLIGAAALRHYYTGVLAGEENDKDTGLNHWYHVGCNLAFLIEYTSYRNLYGQFDDRFMRPGPTPEVRQ